MYVILIDDDNVMKTTKKERIMQRSKLVSNLCFLVKPTYNDYDMSLFTVSLEYVLPASKLYRNELLSLSSDLYNGYLKYTLPIDTMLTCEPGEIELQITFLYVDINEQGESVQRVRKVDGTSIMIMPIKAWSDIIPDSALTALDQRIIKTDAQIKALSELTENIGSPVDGLDYDDVSNEIQLKSGEKLVGNRVELIGLRESIEDGVPIVRFNEEGNSPDDSQGDLDDDNVVEF